MNFSQLIIMCTTIIRNNKSNPLMNMLKLQEETGELAKETFKCFSDRQNTINEIADVVICAVAQGEFIKMMPDELEKALYRKAVKGIESRKGRGVTSNLLE